MRPALPRLRTTEAGRREVTKPRIIGCDEDGKAIYAPRPFHASPTNGSDAFTGYKLYCRRCKTTTLSKARLPHDLAATHECLYDPDTEQLPIRST